MAGGAAALGLLLLAWAAGALPVPGQPAPAAAAARGAGEPNRGLRVVPLAIATADGRVYRYRVEVAETPAQQAVGMMHRTAMARDTGMLFPMAVPRPAAFWMRNTLISLDIIFIGTDGRVQRVAHRARPLSDELIPSDGPVAAVLELKGGEAARIGLRPGDRVTWPSLGRAGLGAAGGDR